MAAVAEISVQPTGDPHSKVYHTRTELVETSEAAHRSDRSNASAFGSMFLDIDGVISVAIGPYLLMVTKAPLFDWAEIDFKVESILTQFVKASQGMKNADTSKAEPAPRIERPLQFGPRAIRSGRATI